MSHGSWPAEDRRAARRYSIVLPARYQLLRGGEIAETGTCTTIDVSSTGVFFRPRAAAPAGTAIELFLSWPAPAETSRAMQLLLRGRLQRSDDRGTAVVVVRWEFRTAPAARAAMA